MANKKNDIQKSTDKQSNDPCQDGYENQKRKKGTKLRS